MKKETPTAAKPLSAMRLTLLRSVGSTAIGVITSSILGRSLGVTGYGRYQLVSNLAAQVGQICEAGIGTAIAGRPRHEKNDGNNTLSVIVRYFLMITVPTILLAVCLASQIVDDFDGKILAAVCMISVSTLAQLLIIGQFRAHGRSGLANCTLILPPLLNLLLIAILWWTNNLTPVDALLALSTAYTLMAMACMSLAFWLCPRSSGIPVHPASFHDSLRELVERSWKSSATRISQLLIYRLDLFLLAIFVGDTALGIYAPAVFLVSQLNHLGDSVGFVLYPSMARKEMTAEHARDACRKLVILASAGALLIALLSPWLLSAIWGSSFNESIEPLFWLLPGYLILAPAKALSAYLAVETQFHSTLVASLSGLFCNCVLNLWLIPIYGAVGAAVATSVALICICVVLSRKFGSMTGYGFRDQWVPCWSDLVFIRAQFGGVPIQSNNQGSSHEE